ncbi:MAG: PIN domain-containing protein [Phycisphaerales bacterium]
MNAVDTNVLIYAFNTDDRDKGPAAAALLDRLAEASGETVILWQVLCEFTAFVAKARQRAAAGPEAFDYVHALRQRFTLVSPGPAVADLALSIHLRDQVSIWDSFLLAACVAAGVDRLYSEDVQSRPEIRGVRIVNPFAAA